MTDNRRAGQGAVSRWGFPAIAAAVAVVLALGGIVAYLAGWRADLGNAAWGAITAALISSVVGVLLKGKMDANLTRMDAQIQTHLNDQKAKLAERSSALAARRDYEYEARKRLYEDVEPLLFQVYEALEEARNRVMSLARTDRNGNLGVGPHSWIADDGYYLDSTVYKLLLPATYLRLMQRRMTFVDLGLVRHIELRYLLLKLYFRSFTDDFEFAKLAPGLEYRPNHPAPDKSRKDAPAISTRQALLLGTLESVADLLVKNEGDKSRAISFGEFGRLFAEDDIDESLHDAYALFRGFSSADKPVLARLLVAQACFARFILLMYQPPAQNSDPVEVFVNQIVHDKAFTNALAWRDGEGGALAIAEAYWVPRLKQLKEELSHRQRAIDPGS